MRHRQIGSDRTPLVPTDPLQAGATELPREQRNPPGREGLKTSYHRFSELSEICVESATSTHVDVMSVQLTCTALDDNRVMNIN